MKHTVTFSNSEYDLYRIFDKVILRHRQKEEVGVRVDVNCHCH
jgi:hypothetical protein